MGRKERRLRDHQEVRQNILDAAREIALIDGWRNVTMRKIAEKIEYSHPALYEYFENKDVLLLELLREGYRLLIMDLQASQTQVVDPHEAVTRLAHAYWQFVWRYPELYRVMYGLDGVSFGVDVAHAEGQEVTDLWTAAITAVCECHGKAVTTTYVYEQVLLTGSWSHGIISLVMAGRIPGGTEQAYALYEQALEDSLNKWESPLPTP